MVENVYTLALLMYYTRRVHHPVVRLFTKREGWLLNFNKTIATRKYCTVVVERDIGNLIPLQMIFSRSAADDTFLAQSSIVRNATMDGR